MFEEHSIEDSLQSSREIYEERSLKQAQFLENTLCYIKNYLDPKRKWSKEVSGRQRIDLVRYADVNWTTISDHIKGMVYRDFLATPYWKAIAAHIKYRAGYRCQLCNNANNLMAHHRNYGIHGREHAHTHELIALCNNCHDKFHRVEERVAQSGLGNVGDKARIVVLGLVVLLVAYLASLNLKG